MLPEIQSASAGHGGSSGVSSWTSPVLPMHYSTGTHHTGTWFLVPLLCSIFHFNQMIQWLLYGSEAVRWTSWMKEHYIQLNLANTELLIIPDTFNCILLLNFTVQLGLGLSTTIPSSSVRSIGVIFDDNLTFKDHIAETAPSCRFALHNVRKIRPFSMEHAAQFSG